MGSLTQSLIRRVEFPFSRLTKWNESKSSSPTGGLYTNIELLTAHVLTGSMEQSSKHHFTLQTPFVYLIAFFGPHLQKILAFVLALDQGVNDLHKDGAVLHLSVLVTGTHHFV